MIWFSVDFREVRVLKVKLLVASIRHANNYRSSFDVNLLFLRWSWEDITNDKFINL